VLGLILKFADSRFTETEATLEGTATARRSVTKSNYQAQGVLYLPEQSRFANLLKLKEGDKTSSTALITYLNAESYLLPSRIVPAS
jgi:hypothetical protein